MLKHSRARVHLVDDGVRLAARAWQRHSYGRAGAPVRWFDLVERFVEDTRPASPERTAAVLLLALDNCPDWDGLVEGGWIYLVSVHVYVHYEGAGVGAQRAHGMVERFLQWLAGRGDLHEWDLACLRWQLDRQRSACGGKARGVPAAYDAGERGANGWAALIERFLVEADLPVADGVAESMIGLIASATRHRGTEVVRFGALDPLELWALLHPGDLDDVSPWEEDAFALDLVRVGACFFGWLADHAHLEPTRARQLQRELLALASGPAGRA